MNLHFYHRQKYQGGSGGGFNKTIMIEGEININFIPGSGVQLQCHAPEKRERSQ